MRSRTSPTDSARPGQALFGEVRLAVLLQVFGYVHRSFDRGELANLTGCPAPAVGRELAHLEREHLVVKNARNGRVTFRADPRARLFAPLHLLALELGDIKPGMVPTRPPRPSSPPPREAPGEACARRVTAVEYDQHFVFIMLTMQGWVLRHLARMYAAFNGDFTAALVLGEVAHHNLSKLAPAVDYDRGRIRAAIAAADGLAALEPCNAFSISEATGIPRETVRRKVKVLVAKGWLLQNSKSELFVSPTVGRDFDPYNFTAVNEFLETAEKLSARLSR